MYKYYLFISYSRHDSRAAAYLQRQLEHFRIPVKLVSQENLPEGGKYLRPVFRDRRDLKNTEKSFTADIKVALEQSRFLLVLCSPNSADSKWVGEEIRHFLETHDGDCAKVVPVILSGRPGSGGAEECLPPPLRTEQVMSRNLPSMIPDDGEGEKAGWENGMVQSLSYMLKVDREKIKSSVDRERLRQTRIYAAIGVYAAVVFALMTLWAVHEKQIAERNRLRAIAGETLAKENENKAKENEAKAKENEAKAKENEARAIESEKKEKEQAEIAVKSLDFLRDMFSGNENENPGNRRVKDVLISRVSEIEKITPDVLRASISEIVGGLLVKNSIYAPAKGLLEYARQFYEKEGKVFQLKEVSSLLGLYYSHIGDFETARKFYLDVVNDQGSPIIYEKLAENALGAGNYQEAEEFAQKGIEIARKNFGETDLQTFGNMIVLGNVYYVKDKLEDQEVLLQKVSNALNQTGQLNTMMYMTTCNEFGKLYMKQEKYDKALDYYQKSLSLTIEFFGESSIYAATIYNNIGQLYISLEDKIKAIDNLEKALKIIMDIHPEGSSLEAQICNNLGIVLLQLNNRAKALDLLNRSLTLSRRICGDNHPDTGLSLLNLAYYYDSTDELEKAIDYNNQALKTYHASLGENTERSATIYNNLGEIYRKKKDYIMAIQQYDEAVAIHERILGQGKMNESLATCHNNLALAYSSLGNRNEALKHISLAVEYAQANLPPGHERRNLFMKNKAVIENSNTDSKDENQYMNEQDKIIQEINMANSFLKKANTDSTDGQALLKKAEKIYTQGLEYYIHIHKTEIPEVALIYNQLGLIQLKQQQYHKALPFFHKAVTINEILLGNSHVETIVNYHNLFTCSQKMENYVEAIKWGQKYIDACLANKQENKELAVVYNDMAFCYGKLNKIEEEEKYYLESLRIHISLKEKDLLNMSIVCVNLGSLYSNKGDYEKSLEYYKKGVQIQEDIKDFPKETLAINYNNMALIMDNYGDKTQAYEYYKKALEINLTVKGDDDLEVATNCMNISLLLNKKQQYQEAMEMAEKALCIRKKKLGNEHEDVYFCYNQLGILYDKLGNLEQSLKYDQLALETALKIWGEEHDKTETCYGNIADSLQKLNNYKEAEKAAKKALEIELLLHGENREKVVTRYFVLGRIYEESDNFDNSFIYFKKCALLALPRQDITDDTKLKYVIRTNVSYRNLTENKIKKEYADFQKLLNSYLSVYTKTKSREMCSALLRENLRVFMATGRLELAKETYRADLTLYDADNLDEQIDISMSHFVMAEAYHENSLFSEAIPYYQMALKIDLARQDVPWSDVKIEYLQMAFSYYSIGKYNEAYKHYEKAFDIIKEKQLKEESINDCKVIMEKCRQFMDGKRMIFRVSEISPGENGEKVGVMLDDVFLAMEGWSIRQIPELPHKSSSELLEAINAIMDKEKDIAFARKVNGTLQVIVKHFPKKAVGLGWVYDYVSPEEYEKYIKLLDKAEGK